KPSPVPASPPMSTRNTCPRLMSIFHATSDPASTPTDVPPTTNQPNCDFDGLRKIACAMSAPAPVPQNPPEFMIAAVPGMTSFQCETSTAVVMPMPPPSSASPKMY